MPDIRLTLLIGRYAQQAYLPIAKTATLTATVRNYQRFLPELFPLVHPSPLNSLAREEPVVRRRRRGRSPLAHRDRVAVKPFLGVNQSLMPAHYIGSRRPVMSSRTAIVFSRARAGTAESAPGVGTRTSPLTTSPPVVGGGESSRVCAS